MAEIDFKKEDMNWFREVSSMKIELTPREIELLLVLLNDAASTDLTLDGPPIFLSEELNLVKKLETALLSSEDEHRIHRKSPPGHISEHKH